MELKIYLKILLKRWWIAIPVFLVTLTSAIVLTYMQPPQYSSKATFIVALSSSFSGTKDFITGLSALSREEAIGSTYAEIAASRLIKENAAQEIGLTKTKGYKVSSRLLAGTNVMEIEVTGPDPEITRDLANAVGARTIEYATKLYEVYPLFPLDEATLSRTPISPNVTLNISLAAVFGLVLGIGVSFLAEYLAVPLEALAIETGIFLDKETGLYNKQYFMQRLVEEMSRARRNKYPLSVALMNIDYLDTLRSLESPEARSEALRKVAHFLKEYVRQEDVVARLDNHIIGFVLPDLRGEEAQTVMDRLQGRLAWHPFELERTGIKLNFTGASGVVSYELNGSGQDDLLALANKALRQAEASGQGKTHLVTEN